ncbi:MAG: hypothetical protein AB7O60_16375 [Variibacter sp.]
MCGIPLRHHQRTGPGESQEKATPCGSQARESGVSSKIYADLQRSEKVQFVPRLVNHGAQFACVRTRPGCALQHIWRLGNRSYLLDLSRATNEEAPSMDVALKLNVVAAFVAFAFIGAILIGAL